MTALIQISKRRMEGAEIQTMNARELHEFLEVETRFNDWIRERVEQFGFSENQDFVSFTENSVKGRPRIEYHLTLDMAKELSMVERNDKGKQARQYFIECERRAKSITGCTATKKAGCGATPARPRATSTTKSRRYLPKTTRTAFPFRCS